MEKEKIIYVRKNKTIEYCIELAKKFCEKEDCVLTNMSIISDEINDNGTINCDAKHWAVLINYIKE